MTQALGGSCLLRLVQTCIKRMRLRSKIENFLTEHDLRVRKIWPMLLRFTRSVWTNLYKREREQSDLILWTFVQCNFGIFISCFKVKEDYVIGLESSQLLCQSSTGSTWQPIVEGVITLHNSNCDKIEFYKSLALHQARSFPMIQRKILLRWFWAFWLV